MNLRTIIAATALVLGGVALGVGGTLTVTAQPAWPAPLQPSSTLSVTWSVAKDHPTQAEVTGCGTWLPVTVYTRAGGVVTHEDACDPNRDAAAVNDAVVTALVG